MLDPSANSTDSDCGDSAQRKPFGDLESVVSFFTRVLHRQDLARSRYLKPRTLRRLCSITVKLEMVQPLRKFESDFLRASTPLGLSRTVGKIGTYF